MKKLLICGINGKMGQNLVELLAGDSEMQAVCGVDLAANATLPPVYASFNDVTVEANRRGGKEHCHI